MSIMRHVHSLGIGQRSRSLRMSSESPRWLPRVLKILFSRARLGARDSSPLHRLRGAMPRMVKTNVFLTWCPVSFECGKTKHLREASSKEAAEQALAEHLRRQPAHVQAGIDEATIEDFVSIASYCRCEKLVMTRSSRRPKIGDKAHGQGRLLARVARLSAKAREATLLAVRAFVRAHACAPASNGSGRCTSRMRIACTTACFEWLAATVLFPQELRSAIIKLRQKLL
jgi:hypothetical protein